MLEPSGFYLDVGHLSCCILLTALGRLHHLKCTMSDALFILCREEVVGRNCRFLQGPGTDPAELQKLRDGLAADRPTTVRLLNYKHDGTPFWNHLQVSPVRDARGKVVDLLSRCAWLCGRF